MGAFISYLHLAHGIDNFFVLAPNLTIYNKLIADFTPGTPKYVFTGIARVRHAAARDHHRRQLPVARRDAVRRCSIRCKVNIFNISKINSEVRGGASPRIKRLSEYIGESYFDYLARLPDLVLLMDESHRYRASAGVRAINELKPILGLELTATPFVTSGHGSSRSRTWSRTTRCGRRWRTASSRSRPSSRGENFNPGRDVGSGAGAAQARRRHPPARADEGRAGDLRPRDRAGDRQAVRAGDRAGHDPRGGAAGADPERRLLRRPLHGQGDPGRFQRSGAEQDEMIERLLKVEQRDEPTEIVIHVNMLKEGWDVTNLYTIVPLRAANARMLIEQTIGRGLRLPYGEAHRGRGGRSAQHRRPRQVPGDRRRGAPARFADPAQNARARPGADWQSGRARSWRNPRSKRCSASRPAQVTASTEVATGSVTPVFDTRRSSRSRASPTRRSSAWSASPDGAGHHLHLPRPRSRRGWCRKSKRPTPPGSLGWKASPRRSISPRSWRRRRRSSSIRRSPSPASSSCRPATSAPASIPSRSTRPGCATSRSRTSSGSKRCARVRDESIGLGDGGYQEARLEDYVVGGLIDFDDINYDQNADLLYDLAGQVARHFLSYLSEDDAHKVLRVHRREIARFVHSQMQPHYWEDAPGYETKVNAGFTPIKASSYSQSAPTNDFRVSPADKSNMAKYLFGGFQRSLHPVQKFQSDTERMLAVILERDSDKWFRPASGQFQITYRMGSEYREYQPDFVAELADRIVMLEPKARNQMDDPEVLAKQDAAVAWCQRDRLRRHLRRQTLELRPHPPRPDRGELAVAGAGGGVESGRRWGLGGGAP